MKTGENKSASATLEDTAQTKEFINQNRKWFLPALTKSFYKDDDYYFNNDCDTESAEGCARYKEFQNQHAKVWYDTGDAVISYKKACDILAQIFGRSAVKIVEIPKSENNSSFTNFKLVDNQGNIFEYYWQAIDFAIKHSGEEISKQVTIQPRQNYLTELSGLNADNSAPFFKD